MADCEHTYVDGVTMTHLKYASGGCKVTYYEAERCTKCGDVVRGDYICTMISDVCVHQKQNGINVLINKVYKMTTKMQKNSVEGLDKSGHKLYCNIDYINVVNITKGMMPLE